MPYLLDGNNLIGAVRKTSRPSEDDRQALIAELAARLRTTRARAILFFDGPGGGRGSSLGALTIRASAGGSADDAIIREVERAARPSEVTVVTGDRGLARRCRDAGSAVLDPAAFFARFGKSAAGAAGAPDAGRIDVADWMEYFGDERNRDGR
jgi:predicted RNA-binding protein with PIN domain